MPAPPGAVPLQLRPIGLHGANAFVATHHRHSPRVRGCIACLSLVDDAGTVRAVAIVGRPVARALQDGYTAEVTRLCSDGVPNAPSRLYSACWRVAQALGYRKLITYIRADEPGTSLRACSGWKMEQLVHGARQWTSTYGPGLSRAHREPIDRQRWAIQLPMQEA